MYCLHARVPQISITRQQFKHFETISQKTCLFMEILDRALIAHVRSGDGALQTVDDHLLETAQWSEIFASKIGLPNAGRLVGLLHDLGKYSQEFQDYIRDITGINGEDAVSTAQKRQGKNS